MKYVRIATICLACGVLGGVIARHYDLAIMRDQNEAVKRAAESSRLSTESLNKTTAMLNASSETIARLITDLDDATLESARCR